MFENIKKKFKSDDFVKSGPLLGRRVAILATDGVEHSEIVAPMAALLSDGADVEVVSPKRGKIKSWDVSNWGEQIDVDRHLDEVNPFDYDCLVLPGGVLNPGQWRKEKKAVEFVRDFLENGKPIAAICHGPQILIETGLLRGRKLTSYSSVKTDLINAGAKWVDEEVVVDGALITSRQPSDIPAFNAKMIEEFVEGKDHDLPSTEGYSVTL